MKKITKIETASGIAPGALLPSVAVFLSALAGLAVALCAVVTR